MNKLQKEVSYCVNAFIIMIHFYSNIFYVENNPNRNILDNNSPFYENWPLPQRPTIPSGRVYHFGPPPILEPLPPLLPHRIQLHPEYQDHDTSLDTPPGAVGGTSTGVSRPGSAHSAPLLDLSIDRHYEFDSARTPTDDLTLNHASVAMLPRTWNRPYLGYNPRTRDRELGPVADLASKERVFSDSEIYSPCFPRGRPGPAVDISARVRAMKAEFAEYRTQQLQEQQQQKMITDSLERELSDHVKDFQPHTRSPTSPPPMTTHLSSAARTAGSQSAEEIAAAASERLETII